MDSIMATECRHFKAKFVSFSCPSSLLVGSKVHTTRSKNQTRPKIAMYSI